jgi:2-isopropylmalate synthase
MKDSDVIFDWNTVEARGPITTRPIRFMDETLRDGIQSPSAIDPSTEDKVELVHLMEQLGIHHVDIGLPGAGKRQYDDVVRIATEVRDRKMKLKLCCACRTMVRDIEPVVEISQKVGIEIEVMAFIGSSPIRQYAEEWTVDFIAKQSAEAIDFAVKHNLPCTYVTEDTTRSRPDTLDRLFRAAIDHGAHGLCLCDTVGHATPDGIRNLIKWTRNLIQGTGAKVQIDWHGHNDRGMAVANALWAIEAGVDRVHVTALGIGERVGNCSIDQLMVNLKLLGMLPDQDMSKLMLFCQLASRACGYPIPKNYPVVGHDAFRTGTGVHAAAILKALKRNDTWLADRVYSGVPASEFGKEQEIEIGFMSGQANVTFWLEKRHVPIVAGLVGAIVERAKRSNRILTDEEIYDVVKNHKSGASVTAGNS